MNIENINNWGLPFVGTIAVIVATVLYSFSKLREINDIASKELIATLKEEVAAQKTRSERLMEENRVLKSDYQRQINELNKEIGELKGLYMASEASKKEYLEILQGRSPEQEKFMELLTNAATHSNMALAESKKYMNDTRKEISEIAMVLQEIYRALKITIEQNQKLEERNKKVDLNKGKQLQVSLKGEVK